MVVINAQKRTVQDVVFMKLNAMEEQSLVSNGIAARNVIRLIFGNDRMLKIIEDKFGFACGFVRATPFDVFAHCRDIVPIHFAGLTTIGLAAFPKKRFSIPAFSTLFLMVPISIRMVA